MAQSTADSHGPSPVSIHVIKTEPNDFPLSHHGRTKRTASAAGLDSAESHQPREESSNVYNHSASGSDDNESDGGHDSRRTSTPEGIDADMKVGAAVVPPAARKNEEVSPLKYFEVADGVSNVKFGCSVCGLLYKWRKSLNKHWSTNHKGHPGDDLSTPEGMKICLADSDYDYKQTGHRRCCNESLLKILEVAPNATEEGVISGLFQCTLCSFQAGGPYEVIYHFKQLHEEKPHACNSCLYRTKWKHDLSKHQFICKGRHSGELKGSNDLEKQLLMSSVKRRPKMPKMQNGLHRYEETPTLSCSHCPFRCQDGREMEQHYTVCHYQVPIDASHPYSIYSVAPITKQSPLRPFVYNVTLKPIGFDPLSPIAHNLFASHAALAPTGPVSEPGSCSSRRASSPFHRPWESSSFEDSLLTPYDDTVSKASSPDKLLPLDLSLKNGEHGFNDSAISSLVSSPSLHLSSKSSIDASRDTAMSSMTSPLGMNNTSNTDGNTSNEKISPIVGFSPSNDTSSKDSGSTQTTKPMSRAYNCKHCSFTVTSTTSFEFRRHCSLHGVPVQYVCDYCNYSNPVKYSVIQHRLIHAHKPGFNFVYDPQSRVHSPEPRLQP